MPYSVDATRQDVGDARVGRKVLAQRLLVDIEARAPQLRVVVRDVPSIEPGIRPPGLVGLQLAQVLEVARLHVADRVPHAVEERVDGLRVAGHLAAKRIRREVGIAVQAGQLAPQLHRLVEQRQVLRPALVRHRHPVALARVGVRRLLHEREVRGIRQRHHVVAGVVALLRRQVRLGQSGHLVRMERDRRRVVADVLVEGDAERRQPIVDRLRAFALVERQRDAGVLEVVEQPLAVFPLDRVGRLRVLHARVEAFALEQLDVERRDRDGAGVGRIARRLVGRQVRRGADRTHEVFLRDRQPVPFVEDAGRRRTRLHRRLHRPEQRELRVALRRDRRRVDDRDGRMRASRCGGRMRGRRRGGDGEREAGRGGGDDEVHGRLPDRGAAKGRRPPTSSDADRRTGHEAFLFFCHCTSLPPAWRFSTRASTNSRSDRRLR